MRGDWEGLGGGVIFGGKCGGRIFGLGHFCWVDRNRSDLAGSLDENTFWLEEFLVGCSDLDPQQVDNFLQGQQQPRQG